MCTHSRNFLVIFGFPHWWSISLVSFRGLQAMKTSETYKTVRKWGLKSKNLSPKNSQLCCVMMTNTFVRFDMSSSSRVSRRRTLHGVPKADFTFSLYALANFIYLLSVWL